MLNVKKFSEIISEISSNESNLSINGVEFQVKGGTLYINDYGITESELESLASVLSNVVIFEGIDKIVNVLQERIDTLYHSDIEREDRVIPLQDIDIVLDYASSNESTYPRRMECSVGQGDQIRDYLIDHLEFYGIQVIKDYGYDRYNECGSAVRDYLSIPELFWYHPWCMDGSIVSANRRLSEVQSSILKHYDPDLMTKSYTPVKLTPTGVEITGPAVESVSNSDHIWESESMADLHRLNVIKSIDIIHDIMDEWEIPDPLEALTNLETLKMDVDNDIASLTFNGNPVGVKSVMKLMDSIKKIHPEITSLIEGKLTGYISSNEGPANPVVYKYYNESNWGSSIASRLFNSLGKICYRWHNDGDDPIDFASDPSFRFMIGVNKFMDNLSFKNRVIFHWGILKVQSTLTSDPNIHYDGIRNCERNKELLNEFIEFVGHLMDSEREGKKVDWNTELKSFNNSHHLNYSYTTPILLEEAPVEIAYNLCGAMWEITKRYPNFLDDERENDNNINPDEF